MSGSFPPSISVNANDANIVLAPGQTTKFSLSSLLDFYPGNVAGLVGAVLRLPSSTSYSFDGASDSYGYYDDVLMGDVAGVGSFPSPPTSVTFTNASSQVITAADVASKILQGAYLQYIAPNLPYYPAYVYQGIVNGAIPQAGAITVTPTNNTVTINLLVSPLDVIVSPAATGLIHFSDTDPATLPFGTTLKPTISAVGPDASPITLTSVQQTALANDFSIMAASGNTNNGVINWTYDPSISSLNFVALGETIQVTEPVKITDQDGRAQVSTVTVTLTGGHPTPQTTDATVSGKTIQNTIKAVAATFGAVGYQAGVLPDPKADLAILSGAFGAMNIAFNVTNIESQFSQDLVNAQGNPLAQWQADKNASVELANAATKAVFVRELTTLTTTLGLSAATWAAGGAATAALVSGSAAFETVGAVMIGVGSTFAAPIIVGAVIAIGAGLAFGAAYDKYFADTIKSDLTKAYIIINPPPVINPVTSAPVVTLQNTNGSAAMWQVNGTTLGSYGPVGANPGSSWSLVGTGAFFTGDTGDYLWRSANGSVGIWQVNGTTVSQYASVATNPGTSWYIEGTGDFYGDGHTDILWQNRDDTVALWDMDGTTISQYGVVTYGSATANPGPNWHIKGTGDFNNDSKTDIVWQNDDGSVALWDMNGTTITSASLVQYGGATANPGAAWHVEGTGDFYGDGNTDILLQNNDGSVAIWDMNGTTITSATLVQYSGAAANPGPTWHIVGTGDYNSDGKTDITLRNDDGSVGVWDMNGATILAAGVVANPGGSWNPVGMDTMRFIYPTSDGARLSATSLMPDEFVLTNPSLGSQTITGFDPMQDMLELSKSQFASFTDVQTATTTIAGGAMINLGHGSSLLLPGVDPASLHASNFALA